MTLTSSDSGDDPAAPHQAAGEPCPHDGDLEEVHAGFYYVVMIKCLMCGLIDYRFYKAERGGRESGPKRADVGGPTPSREAAANPAPSWDYEAEAKRRGIYPM